MNDVIFQDKISQIFFFDLYLIAFGEVRNYTHFGILLHFNFL
jgi:hypothetical protein